MSPVDIFLATLVVAALLYAIVAAVRRSDLPFPERLLAGLGDIRPGEGSRAMLMLLNIFLLLTAYYVIKTVREPMILADGSAELKSWASAGQAMVLLVFVPFYGWVSSKLPRNVLIVAVSGFFVLCLQAFYPAALDANRISDAIGQGEDAAEVVAESAAGTAVEWAEAFPDLVQLGDDGTGADLVAGAETDAEEAEDEEQRGVALGDFFKLGFFFYVWVGIFSLAMIAQFWSFANDIYTREAGNRIFPIIAIGATAGAAAGSKVTGELFASGVQTPMMLQIAAALVVCHGAVLLYTSRAVGAEKKAADDNPANDNAEATPTESGDDKLDGAGGFALVLRSPYLRLVALVILLLNVVNTNGEYLLGRLIRETGVDLLASGEISSLGGYIGGFYGDFFSVVNVLTMLVQAFLVSRIVKYIGMRGVLFALPFVALGAYGLLVAGVGLTAYRWAKTAENTTDYSIMNTAKALMWLPTSRAEKYKAKQAIDTLVVRLGDVASLGLVVLGTTVLSFSVRTFALVNLVLVFAWLAATVLLYRRYQSLVDDRPPGTAGGSTSDPSIES